MKRNGRRASEVNLLKPRDNLGRIDWGDGVGFWVVGHDDGLLGLDQGQGHDQDCERRGKESDHYDEL